jgi:hypothetical protein
MVRNRLQVAANSRTEIWWLGLFGGLLLDLLTWAYFRGLAILGNRIKTNKGPSFVNLKQHCRSQSYEAVSAEIRGQEVKECRLQVCKFVNLSVCKFVLFV